MSASHILQKVLERADDASYWRRRIAKFRTFRLPVILLQGLMRLEEYESNGYSEIMTLLPTKSKMNKILKHPDLAIHSREALDYYVYVLRGRDDRERCQRYLEKHFLVPQFIFNFLVRPSADFNDTDTLLAMIESCQSYLDASERAKLRAKLRATKKAKMTRKDRRFYQSAVHHRQKGNIDNANFLLIMRLLLIHCLRLEPRLIVLLAEKASLHIQNMASHIKNARKLYLRQCDAFNRCLEIFQPQPLLQTVRQAMPNAYFWEAQRMLLIMSSGLTKPLLVSRTGFRAIRHVLSGQPKNHTESYSSSRHAPGWPPYLQPGHGMDELSDPEDNWSRTVIAGMLMQEAGYPKNGLDTAVDILQGMSMNGSPTIQQRRALGRGRNIGVWEASIRATRNAQEAWGRFRNPPKFGMKPGIHQYAAMFEKLMMRQVDPGNRALPGDKALNFPTQHEANLTEFESARLRPPSVGELYQNMKLAGIKPEGACLCILVANAESLETAHGYLRDSPGASEVLQNLMKPEPDARLLMTVPLRLFAAYIQVCLRGDRARASIQLMRAVRLSEVRLRGVRTRWMAFVWGIILKDLGQHHRAIRLSPTDQLDLISRVADTIETRAGLQLSTFKQFNTCVKKVIRREVNNLLFPDLADHDKCQPGFVQALYDQARPAVRTDLHASPSTRTTTITAKTRAVLQRVGSRLKAMFWALAEREQDVQRVLDPHLIAPLERLSLRRDVIRSQDAYRYMLTLGYLGQFDEMARLLDWLIQQWGHLDVVSALREMDELHPSSDFFETLCLFRLVAEPMLDRSVPTSLSQRIVESGLSWTWPNDEAVKAYADVHSDGLISAL